MSDTRTKHVNGSRLQQIIDAIDYIDYDTPVDAPEWMVAEARRFAGSIPRLSVEQVATAMRDRHPADPSPPLRKAFVAALLRSWLDHIDSKRSDTVFLESAGPQINVERWEYYVTCATSFKFHPVWKSGDPRELDSAEMFVEESDKGRKKK